MKLRNIAIALVATLLGTIWAATSSAQMKYPIQNGTLVDYIDYGGQYANIFSHGGYPITVNGTLYYVSMSAHVTPGNSAATSGSITFVHYTDTGEEVTNESLDNLVLNPFQLYNATLTASYSTCSTSCQLGTFVGSLTFNIQVLSRRYGIYELENSFFTLDSGGSAKAIPLCGSRRVPCNLSAEQCFRRPDCFVAKYWIAEAVVALKR